MLFHLDGVQVTCDRLGEVEVTVESKLLVDEHVHARARDRFDVEHRRCSRAGTVRAAVSAMRTYRRLEFVGPQSTWRRSVLRALP